MKKDNDGPLFSFAIITDTHIANNKGFAIDGSLSAVGTIGDTYRDLITRVNSMNPEFVVHLGDFADPVPVSGAYDDAALAFHKASEVLTMPYYLVPGNHDIGEKIHKALPKLDVEVSITKSAIQQYEQHFGPQRYSFEHKGCLFLAINTLLLNSGLDDERAQWEWLEKTLNDHAGKRVFVFTHYPLYLSSRDEPGLYDNIEEPARTRLLNTLKPFNVEGYYAGHVHNFFYNQINGMHQFVLPSVSINRIDYMEFYRNSPARDVCRFDPAKTGFFWVSVYADGHVPYLIRTNNDRPFWVHSWKTNGATAVMDLRTPWCDEADIATPWGVEIFERKYVRNDYPLSALWEMGITDLRVPISDLLDPRVSDRIKELAALGHKFTVVMFGAPNKERRAALAAHADGIKAIEVVALFDQWQDLAAPLKQLGQSSDFEIYLTAVRPEVEGWTTSHGMHTDLTDEVDWVLNHTNLGKSVDGFVFGIRADMAPFDGFSAVQKCLAGTSFKPLVHVPCVRMDWIKLPSNEDTRLHEQSRTAEAVFLARTLPETSIVLDNFVEVDRGYGSCHGLVDRLYNPKDGSRIVTALNSLLPRQISNVVVHEAPQHRIVVGEIDAGHVMLILANNKPSSEAKSHVLDELFDKTGSLIDLVTGAQSASSYKTIVDGMNGSSAAKSPMLLTLKS